MGIYEVFEDKEYLQKIISGTRYPIPIKISYANVIACFTIDSSFRFETRGKIINSKNTIGFLPDCLKF